jgi:hypothetical protein
MVTADSATEARFHDEQAREHFSARRFAEAIEEFLWSNRIAPELARGLQRGALLPAAR